MKRIRRTKRVHGPNYAVPCLIIFVLGLFYAAWCSRSSGAPSPPALTIAHR